MMQSLRGPRRLAARYDALAFFALTLALTWGVWGIGYWLSGTGTVPFPAMLVGAFGPASAGALVTSLSGGSVRAWAAQVVDWRVRPRWYAVAVLVPLASYWALVPALAWAGVTVDLSLLPGRVPMWVAGVLFVLVAGGGNEEPGWRGFALPRLQERYGALAASLGIGVVWAVWHAPLFLTGQARNLTGDFALYAVVVCALSVLLTWLYNATGGSVLLAMLFHANVNTGVLVPFRQSAFAANPALFDAVQTAVFVALALGVVALTRGRLGRDDAPTPETVGAPATGRDRAAARRTGDPGD